MSEKEQGRWVEVGEVIGEEGKEAKWRGVGEVREGAGWVGGDGERKRRGGDGVRWVGRR